MKQATAPQRWQKVKTIFQEVVELAPHERADFLAAACAEDENLRAQVERMLAADDSDPSWLESSPVQHLIEAAQQIQLGQIIGAYQIKDKLGAGGMGDVYRAHDLRLEREVAVKVLPAMYTADESRVQRFVREAKAASALNHPNILTIHEVGHFDRTHFIVTELVEGKTLRRLMDECPLPLADVTNIALQIASALATAHEAGIVHRDIKPENIMLRPDGLVKVLDFGLAKLTERWRDGETERLGDAETSFTLSRLRSVSPSQTDAGTLMGTARYMSPEQARGVDVDARSDIFSFGIVLYEMLAGQPPFQGETTTDVIVSVVEKDPLPVSEFVAEVPVELHQIINKALQKDRDARYQSSKELLADLKSCKRALEAFGEDENRELIRRPPSRQHTAARFTLTAEYLSRQIKQHNRASLAALAIVVVAISTVSGFFFSKRTYALTEKDTVLLADFVNKTGDPVFDGSLKQALAAQLEQTPFLNFYPEERVRETLKLMNRAPDERLTRDVAHEICLRQGLKAALIGTITKFDRNYSITLEALDAHNGAVFASTLVEAEGRDSILHALDRAANQLREKLGESLSSIQRFAIPMEQGTTSSLDALKAVSLAREQFLKGNRLEAITLYKRAIELDPNFALPYARLANTYDGIGQSELANEFGAKAYQLRERTSEREKFYISSIYYDCVTGELEKDIEILKVWTQTYPRDVYPHNTLAMRYHCLGNFEESANEAREAQRLDPNYVFPYGNLAAALMRLGRYEESSAAIQQAQARKLDSMLYHLVLFRVGFAQGNEELLKQQIAWGKGRLDELHTINWQSLAAAFNGQLQEADELTQRSVTLMEQRNLREAAASVLVDNASRQALAGNQAGAKANLVKALTLSPGILTRGYRNVVILPLGPLIYALNGDVAQAQSWLEETAKRNPTNSLSQTVWIPATRAAIELRRGQANKQARKANEASAEFQRIIAHRGWEPTSMLWPLAHLGLARAAALNNDLATSRSEYERFLSLWSNADAELPLLLEVKKEYEKLKQN